MNDIARKAKYEKDLPKINHYKKLTSDLLDLKEHEECTLENLEKTTKLLALNPEFYTIWNYRREILIELFKQGLLDTKITLENDLKLVMSQLKLYPKCYWIWNHRIWCLFKLQEINQANWEFELMIVSKLLELDSRNFHGWHYRRFIVENIETNSKKLSGNSNESDKGLLELFEINIKEFKYTTTKINKNISNFSAWHNRSKLIPKIFEIYSKIDNKSLIETNEINHLFTNPYQILCHDLELIKTGIYMDANDSSVWLYLFWLLTDDIFVTYLKQEHANTPSYVAILYNQLEIIEELNELEKDDHISNWDNVWCLKSFILIKKLIKNSTMDEKSDSIDDETKVYLNKLIEYDPLRKGRYLDQLNGISPLI